VGKQKSKIKFKKFGFISYAWHNMHLMQKDINYITLVKQGGNKY